MGTPRTGSAALKKRAVAQAYPYAYIRDSLMGQQKARDAHRDENGVDRCQMREIGGESRQKIV